MIQRSGFREDAALILIILVAGSFLALLGISRAIDASPRAWLEVRSPSGKRTVAVL